MNTDIILNTKTNDLTFFNGDFVIANSEQQDTNLIINTFVGNWFQFPLVGVGIIKFLAGNETALFIEQQIKNQMVTDGFVVDSVSIKGSTFENVKIQILAHR
jgi:hypothetical protein